MRGWTIEPITAPQALAYLGAARSASWQQFPAYAAEAARTTGSHPSCLLIAHHGMAQVIGMLRSRRLPILGGGIALIAQGPVVLGSAGDAATAMKVLADQIVGIEGLTLRVSPPVDGDLTEEAMTNMGFRPVPGTGYNTFVLDITGTEDDLRAGLDAKWRSDLGRGERGPVTITRSHHPKDFAALQPLLTELADRKGFAVPQDAEFFARVAGQAREPEHFAVHLAWHEGQLIGGHIGAFSGNMAVYLIGATNAEGRDLRASFLLQWAVIRYARERGIAAYDLGGIDEVGNPDVFRFKQRMGGRRYSGPPSFELRPSGVRGALVNLAEAAYKRLSKYPGNAKNP